jgi:hypothetical protein
MVRVIKSEMMKFKLLIALVASVVMFGSVSQSYATGAWNTEVVFAPGDDGEHSVPTQSHSTTSTLFMDDIDSAVAFLEYSSRQGASVSYNGSAGNCSMGGMIVPCKMLF